MSFRASSAALYTGFPLCRTRSTGLFISFIQVQVYTVLHQRFIMLSNNKRLSQVLIMKIFIYSRKIYIFLLNFQSSAWNCECDVEEKKRRRRKKNLQSKVKQIIIKSVNEYKNIFQVPKLVQMQKKLIKGMGKYVCNHAASRCRK